MNQKIFTALGTVNTIALYCDCDTSILDLAKQRVLELHQLFSVFDPQSEISEVNEKAGICPVQVSDDTFYLLSLAINCAKETSNVYDVTAGALSKLWREAISLKRIPSDEEINQCRLLLGIHDLELNDSDHSVFLRRAGMRLDLGGIAKGYAADEVRKFLKEKQVEKAMINLGGTIITIGGAWNIGITNPFIHTDKHVAEMLLQNTAIVTSGAYERYFFFEGKRYHHIVDPRIGMPSRSGLSSVTLIGDNAARLDALATGIFILGAEDSQPILQRNGIEAVFINEEGVVQITPGLRECFAINA